MESHKEEKDHLSYSEIENQIINTDAFKNIIFEIQFPNNRDDIIKALTPCFEDHLQKLSKVSVLEMVPNWASLVECFNDVMYSAKHNQITLPDLYDQIYNKIFHEDNLKKIMKTASMAFAESKISILEYYKIDKSLAQLSVVKSFVQSKIQKSEEGEAKIDDSLTQKGIMHYIYQSGVIKYLKNTVDDFLKKEMKEWKAYSEIASEHERQELEIHYFKNKPDWSTAFVEPDFIAIKRVLQKKEHAFPDEHRCTPIAKAFSVLDKSDLEKWVLFLNQYREQFPDVLNEKLKNNIIIEKINALNEAHPKYTNAIKVLIPPSDSRKIPESVRYGSVRAEVYQFLDHENAEIMNDQSILRFYELWKFTAKLIEKNPHHKLYLLAFMQYMIAKIYQGNIADDGIARLNETINRMLVNKKTNGDAINPIVDVAIQVLLRITEPQLRFGRLKITGFPGYFNQERNRCVFPTVLRDAFNDYAQSFHRHSKEVSRSDTNPSILLLQRQLSEKEREYFSLIQNAIPTYVKYTARDETYMEKLLLRLVAINYFREKIQSGRAYSQTQLSDDLTLRYGDLILQTRRIKKSRIAKIIESNVLSAPTTFVTESKPHGTTSIGLFEHKKEEEAKTVDSGLIATRSP